MLAASLAPEPASAVTSEMASTTIGTAIKLLASRGMVAGTVRLRSLHSWNKH